MNNCTLFWKGNLLILGLLLLMISFAHAQPLLIGARFPALSPDGTKIAFSYMGDLWLVSSEGGKAERLTNNVAYDREPVWSPDGKWLAFSSDRLGNNDVFLLPVSGGEIKQLTHHTGNDVATAFSPDGKWVLFTSSRASLTGAYKISIDGGNAIPLLDHYWNRAFDMSMSADGKTLLFSRGSENRFWWRRGYRGSNSSKIWALDLANNKPKPVVSDDSNCYWPEWSSDGTRVYFVSDRGNGTANIWSASRDGADVRAVTKFSDGDVRWFSKARNAPSAVYERNFGIWFTHLQTGESRAVRIDAPAETKENQRFFAENERVSEFAVSPDGKKIAAVVRGEVFVLSEEGGYARNVSNTPWRERNLAWDRDSRNVIYVSDIGANPDLYKISALGGEKPQRLTTRETDDQQPQISPDGKLIAYFSGARQIRLMDIDGKNDRLLIEDDFGGRFANGYSWSPDSRFLAYATNWAGNSDIFAIKVESGEKTLLTNTAYDEDSPVWSPDGKFMLFSSNRYGHSFPEFRGKRDIYQVYFAPQPEDFEEEKFEKLFLEKKTDGKKEDEKSENVKKPEVEISFKLENPDLQTEQVANTLGNESSFVLSPKDTSTIYFVSNIDGSNHLWTTSLKKDERGKYEPFMPGVKNPFNLQIDAKGNNLYYLSNGRIGKIELGSKKTSSIAFDTKIEVDKTADFEQMLAELYYTLQYYYYDANHHNVNWKQVYHKFRPVLQQVREEQDFYDYANMMIGYLNSSHTGIGGRFVNRVEQPSAHIGADWDFSGNRVALERILKDGPLYAHRDSIQAGDALVSIDGAAVRADKNIWPHLNGKNDKRVKLVFTSSKLGRNVEVAVKPVSSGSESRLRLEEWIASRKETVKQKTGDNVAYLYMRAMGQGDLRRFLKELERDAVPRKGLILDLRYNNGGNVHDRVIEALMKPVYAKWRIRGLSEVRQSTYGFADKPMVILVNEQTLSDGEMVTNGLKTLKRGQIVGNTTYGWLIFTTGVGLMNGGFFRLPFWGCYALDGTNLETSGGVTPDIRVINELANDLAGDDPQLEKAIEVILGEIGGK